MNNLPRVTTVSMAHRATKPTAHVPAHKTKAETQETIRLRILLDQGLNFKVLYLCNCVPSYGPPNAATSRHGAFQTLTYSTGDRNNMH